METYIWSDLHIGHAKLAENWRPDFGGNVPAHNEEIRNRWNSTVRPDDEVWILGDVCMGILTDSLEFAKTLHGEKHLVPGNHDRFHEAYSMKNGIESAKTEKFRAMYAEVFTLHESRFMFDPKMIFCHFPWKGTEDHADRDIVERFGPVMEDYDADVILVHGHEHKKEKTGPRSVHVGVDAWEVPVRMDVVENLAATLRVK